MLNFRTLLLVAAIAAVPATGAYAALTAPMVAGLKADAVPVANLVSMVGSWTQGDLSILDKAHSIKVYDAKTVYSATEQQQIASAATTKADQLTKFRAAIRADADLSAWFTANHIDINRVVAVADPNGNAEIFLN